MKCLSTLFSTASYTIYTYTSMVNHAETDDIDLRILLEGSEGSVRTGYFDNPGKDDFVRGAMDRFVFTGLAEVGHIHCIRLEAGADDWWMFDKVRARLNKYMT